MKAATVLDILFRQESVISIHAAREGGDCPIAQPRYSERLISIHAAREGGDERDIYTDAMALNISIHAAREGGDIAELWFMPSTSRFQSTPPVKAATFDAGVLR